MAFRFNPFTGAFDIVETVDHDILSAAHSDALVAAVVRGDIIIGNSTPKWSRKAVGTGVLTADGTDVTGYTQAPTLTTPSMTTPVISTLLDLTAGQIKFPASQIASSDANTLDDYEEGTWTPSIAFGGASTGIVYASRNGVYIKAGKLVFVSGAFALTNKGSSTGNAAITGLPFTSNSTALASVFFKRSANLSTITALAGSVPTNATTIDLGDLFSTVANDTHFNNNTFVDAFTAVYAASA